MKYVEFRDLIKTTLDREEEGLTWLQLRDKLELPYKRPCPEWTNRLEKEIGLIRVKGEGRAFIWLLSRN